MTGGLPVAADRSLGSMRLIWLAHLAFLGLYTWIGVDRAGVSRVGHPFFTSPWFPVLFAVPAAVGALGIGRPLRGRLRWSGACLLRWSLAEVPALVGLIGYLSGGTAGVLAGHLVVSAVLLAILAPSARGRDGWFAGES